MIDLFCQKLPERIKVRVSAKAASNRMKIEHAADGTVLVRVYVTVVAEHGKANAAVIALLAKAWGIPKSSLTILHGHTTRDKVIAIAQD